MTEVQTNLSNDGCQVKTIIQGSTSYTFNWTVENFSKFILEMEKKSPTFRPLPNRAFYATLKIMKNLEGYLEFHYISGKSIEVKHDVSIKNKAGAVILANTTICVYDNRSAKIVCDVLPNCATIMEKARQENVLNLKVVMEFYVKDETDTYCEPQLNPVSPLDGLSALSNELKVMYDKLSYTDVSLRVGDSIVRVHKFVLCARSPVFARMFETPMDEREENVINITDVDPPVLKDLVSYLYTGVLAKDDFESVYALYYAADKYDVPSLRKACIDALRSKLEAANACRVLVLADRHSDHELKDSVVRFIKLTFDEVLEADAWNELVKNAPRLATEVISAWCKYRKDMVKTNTT